MPEKICKPAVFFILGDTLASEFYIPTFRSTLYEDGTECSEMSAHKIRKPENHPKERIQHSEHGEILKRRICTTVRTVCIPDKI
jgi:hypothetical protein